jgi:hypothetical protein
MDVIKDLGPSELARRLNCKPPSVLEWRTRGIPPVRCTEIERVTEGKYPCEQIRPDVAWARVPDPEWPWHPEGRPCIDVARPVAVEEQRDAA